MSSRHHRSPVEQDLRLGDGASNRHRCPLPEGRGADALLIIQDGGTAVVVLPFARRQKGMTQAQEQSIPAVLQTLTDLQRAGRLPRSGVSWVRPDGLVPVSVEPSWIARQFFDRASLQIRLLP